MNGLNWNSLLKYLLGFFVIGGVLAILARGVFNGFVEGDITSAVVGGALIPVLILVIQFFFRKSGPGEGTTNGNGNTPGSNRR